MRKMKAGEDGFVKSLTNRTKGKKPVRTDDDSNGNRKMPRGADRTESMLYWPEKQSEQEKKSNFGLIEIDDAIKENAKVIKVGDLDVYFPFEPYPDQVKYIEAVIQALNNKSNALLESPTGTGKTLCLLTATLAWLTNERKKKQEEGLVEEFEEEGEDGTSEKTLKKKAPPIRIIYTSRTHSQLNQVVKELKNICYRPIVSAVGSRDHLCINEAISSYKGRMKNLKCKELVVKNACEYINKNDKTRIMNLKNSIVRERKVLDIEDMNELGREHATCPFFTMKALNEQADVLLMPYNYLTDKNIRDTYERLVQNCILIFDEAHNIEKAAEEGASVSLSYQELNLAITELSQLKDCIHRGLTNNGFGKDRVADMSLKLSYTIYLQSMIGQVAKRFEQYADKHESNKMADDSRFSNMDEARPFADSIDLFFGKQETGKKLMPLCPVIENVPKAIDEMFSLIKSNENKLNEFNSRTFNTFFKMLVELDTAMEFHPDVFKVSSGGINLHKVLNFFAVFSAVYDDMIENLDGSEWGKLRANHFTTNFSTSFNEKSSRLTI